MLVNDTDAPGATGPAGAVAVIVTLTWFQFVGVALLLQAFVNVAAFAGLPSDEKTATAAVARTPSFAVFRARISPFPSRRRDRCDRNEM
jgi:hypothetical protein